MSQTSYSRDYTPAFAGQLGDTGPHRIESWTNSQGADIPAGILVVVEAEGQADLPAGATELLAGAVLNSFARNPGDAVATLSGTAAIKSGDVMNVLSFGAVWLLCEEAMAVNDDVFVRYAAGTGTQLGAIRNDADTTTARKCPGVRVLQATTAAGPCLCFVDVAADTAVLA